MSGGGGTVFLTALVLYPEEGSISETSDRTFKQRHELSPIALVHFFEVSSICIAHVRVSSICTVNPGIWQMLLQVN